MNAVINALSAQANELMKNDAVVDMLRKCATYEEKCLMLAIASMHALSKVNI